MSTCWVQEACHKNKEGHKEDIRLNLAGKDTYNWRVQAMNRKLLFVVTVVLLVVTVYAVFILSMNGTQVRRLQPGLARVKGRERKKQLRIKLI